ncbi:hypothetical protein AB205_0101330 [Aquarana catesbeiana]|uniref:Uncharacterized protein n=1 Tax=Aquarana catesbeiana TaxID=8400 RepID=A0A2G9SIW2_AQUCT|nr:hypothetical protein AB205_0101330 [Aquarana catesbeiana]
MVKGLYFLQSIEERKKERKKKKKTPVFAKTCKSMKFSGLRYEPAYDPHPLKKLPKGYSFLIFDQYFTTISTKEPMDLALTI